MDKYQSNALKSVNFCCINDEEKKADVSLENGQLVIIQNENYNIINYDLLVDGNNIEKVEFFNEKWIDSTMHKSKWNAEKQKKILPMSFAGGTTKIRITFGGGFVDPVELPIEYVGADRNKWDQKHKEEVIAEYTSNLSLCSTAGTTFFETLFFQPCSDMCKKTVVEWYAVCKGTIEKNRQKSEILKTNFLGKDEILDGRCYSNSPSIAIRQVYHRVETGFSFGGYNGYNSKPKKEIEWNYDDIAYVIKQYDSEDNLLVEVSSENMPK